MVGIQEFATLRMRHYSDLFQALLKLLLMHFLILLVKHAKAAWG